MDVVYPSPDEDFVSYPKDVTLPDDMTGPYSMRLSGNYVKTSLSTSGRSSAIRINDFVAPGGSRRCCSQSCGVRTDTPGSFANFDCHS